jgi:hypothetical protein
VGDAAWSAEKDYREEQRERAKRGEQKPPAVAGENEGRQTNIDEIGLLLATYVRVAMMIRIEDIENLVRAVDREETILPLLDPTKYVRDAPNLSMTLKVGRAFLKFRKELEAIT